MQSDILSRRPKNKTKWHKVKRVPGLYQYIPSDVFHARVRHGGKLYRESLDTKDLAFAKRKLADFKERLERTDPRLGRITLIAWLENVYAPTLKGAPGAMKAKQRIIAKIKETWFSARKPMRDIKKSQVVTWLNEEYGDWSESYWNSALSLIRDAFDAALGDHVVPDNPVAGLTYRKRKKPIRTAPTFEQFKQIVADIRGQPFNRAAEDSGDFVEAMGLLGLGQAELASLKRSDVDLQSERLVAYRHKTDTGFVVPLFPQARPLIEKLCKGKKPHERLFAIGQARKAIASSCARLGFLRELSDGRMVAQYTHRSLRRMFIIRALERGINPQVVALWQGHKDGGKLILDTYSFVRREHERTMAALLTEREPAKVIPITTQA